MLQHTAGTRKDTLDVVTASVECHSLQFHWTTNKDSNCGSRVIHLTFLMKSVLTTYEARCCCCSCRCTRQRSSYHSSEIASSSRVQTMHQRAAERRCLEARGPVWSSVDCRPGLVDVRTSGATAPAPASLTIVTICRPHHTQRTNRTMLLFHCISRMRCAYTLSSAVLLLLLVLSSLLLLL